MRASPSRILIFVVIALAVVHFAGIFARGVRPRVVRGDARDCYVQLRSAVFDHDLDFENDQIGLISLDFKISVPPPGFTWTYERTPNGHVRNFMPVGPAVLWAPLYLVVTGALYLLSLLGLAHRPDGFELALQLVPDVCGVAAAGLVVYFTYLLGKSLYGVRAALWAALGALVGTPLIYYATVSPSSSNTLSAMTASALFLYWWKTRDRIEFRRYIALGALAGLAALVRWQDGILLGAVVLDTVYQWRAGRQDGRRFFPFAVPRLLAAAGAALVVFSPQMVVWQVLYGQPLTMPQGGDFMKWFSPHPLDVLLSPFRGLFSWTPLTALGIAGLVPLWRRHQRAALLMGLFFLVSTYINASVVDWWAGEAFGARRFLSSFAPFAIGLGAWFAGTRWRDGLVRVAITCAAITNLFLLAYYEAFMLGALKPEQYPDHWQALWIDRFTVPIQLAAAWITKLVGSI